MVSIYKCQKKIAYSLLFFLLFPFRGFPHIFNKKRGGGRQGRTEGDSKGKKIKCFGQSKYLYLQFSGVKSCRIWLAAYLTVHRNQMMRCLNFITLSTVNCALSVLLSLNCRHKIRDCLQSYSKNVPKQNLQRTFFL